MRFLHHFAASRKWQPILALITALFAVSCDDDTVVRVPRIESLPSYFRLTAEAFGTASRGRTAECRLDFIFELRSETSRTEDRVSYSGVHGGEVFRRILEQDGSGFVFFADAFGAVDAYLYFRNNQVIFRIPVNDTVQERFWRQLAQINGYMDDAGHGSGTWICAPFDIDQGGYLDNELIVPGTWTIEPIPQ